MPCHARHGPSSLSAMTAYDGLLRAVREQNVSTPGALLPSDLMADVRYTARPPLDAERIISS
jgi:hypothetical protein